MQFKNSRIAQLLRTNTALILLCIISIGVLVLVFHKPAPSSAQLPSPNSAEIPTKISMQSSLGNSAGVPVAEFENMPATTTYESFVYAGEADQVVSLACTDIYNAVIVYPSSLDYRVAPSSFVYNVATPCTKDESATTTISFADAHLLQGSEYYIIRAAEGNTGSWHDPY